MATLLQISALSKAYGPQVIFESASLTINEKQKIGVIGRNGAGKSTLFKLIVGDETAETGTIHIHDITRLGYLKQHDTFLPDETVMTYLERSSGKEAWQCAKLAGKFQLKNEQLDAPIRTLSGGYQMRVKLTAMLLQDPNLLFLDEPTNYLDLSTLILLEEFLRIYRGSFLIISHDREFLKNTCEETLEVERGKIVLYPRPLEEYLAFKADQVEMKERHNKNIEREKKHLQTFVDRFRYKASKATQAQSKLKQIAKLKTITIENPLATVRMHLPAIEPRKGLALRTNKLAVGYTDRTVAEDITIDIERGEHIAILGDNGQGKTTLLKTVAGVLPQIAGLWRWMPHIEVGYYAQHVPSMLNPHDQVYTYLERTAHPDTKKQEILAMAGSFLFHGDDVKKTVAVLSGGERARLCLAGLLLAKKSVLLLDEPTNHLDFETVEALGLALQETNTTILFVSHNRTFVNLVATSIIEVGQGRVMRYPHNYEEYVYHLEQILTPERLVREASALEPEVAVDDSAEARKARHEALKEKKKILRDIEHDLAEHEREKQKILRYFEKHPTDFNKEKVMQLNDLTKFIEEEEQKWLAMQEEILAAEET